ncbi:hypothetical protein L1049_003323 [Liquidambar formosana]|uniref:Uncharacterized protein n=1 Tax=Liquidambar formosana TaxID=63359 RepID=A0AAP0NMG8_LIQFO
MEQNRKRRGWKLVTSIYRPAKPSSTVQYSSNRVKPSQSSPSTASVGYLVDQDFVTSQPKPKVSFIVPDNGRNSYGQIDNSFGASAGDENVDLKAASYIATVQERFKLERINSERKKYQDMY